MAKQGTMSWHRVGRTVACLIVAIVIIAGLRTVDFTGAAGTEAASPAWSSPQATTIKHVSPLASAQHEPNFLSSLDCNLVTYRRTATDMMETGCFTSTAYGMVDSDSSTVIFNGTDEGLPLLAYVGQEVLVPWPGALNLIALDNASTGGSYINLYKNPLAVMQDTRNLRLQLVAKQLTGPADIHLRDPAGQQLVINPQSIAFSDGGSWMVVETLSRTFVRINLATLDMVAFAPSYSTQGSPALLRSQVAISESGRYVAVVNDTASVFKVYDLATCTGVTENLQARNCQAYDYRPFAQTQIGGLKSVRHPRFVNNRLLSFEATTSTSKNDGIYELAPTAGINSLIDYLGLGDSYTSGEGAYNYLADTDSPNNRCHLSAHSYPLLLTHDLFSNAGGHSVACSGAVINDIGSTSNNYRGQVKNAPSFQQLQQTQSGLLGSVLTNFAPGYVAQQRFVQQYQPSVATVSVGGNDIGFDDILVRCVTPHISLHFSDNACYNTYEDRLEVTKLIDRTVPRWTALYKQLAATSPSTRLYVIGYPIVASDTGNCALNVHLAKSELEFSQQLIVYLNGAIKQAADKVGINYIDISQALAGHRLCETASYNMAVNGLTAGTDAGVFGINVFGSESYHPNALGQSLIEQAILKQTHNFTTGSANTANGSSSQSLLNAPKSGRQVNTLVPDHNLTARMLKPATNSELKANGTNNGLKPKTGYTIRLDGPTGTVISTVTSDDLGDITTGITLPIDIPPGGHTIDVIGTNQGGGPVDVWQPVYVPVNSNDGDGDGIADTLDSCPTIINSGEDSDHDGIDDGCDGFIGQPPSATSTPTPTPPLSPAGSNEAIGGQTSPISTLPLDDQPSASLGTPMPTIISSFLVNDDQSSLRAAPEPVAIGLTRTARLLGAATTNPISVAPRTFHAVAPTSRDRSRQLFKILPRINVLPWVILPIMAWWLLLLVALGIRHAVNREASIAHS